METPQFEKSYNVHVYETGPDGRLTLYSLFNYMQDIASDHAEQLGFGRDDLLRENRFWVLSRIYAEFRQWPGWGSSLKLRTWPEGTDKLFALRGYEAFLDGNPIASASSSWLILDRETKKIQRPDTFLGQYNGIKHPGASHIRTAMKLEAAEGVHDNVDRIIRTSDLDINLHTNNVKYLEWASDTYDIDFLMDNSPVSAEINYLAESRFGEEVKIMTSACKGDYFSHSIVRCSDNKELCRIRIRWSKN